MEIGIKRASPQDVEVIVPLVAAFHAEEGVEQAPEARRTAVETLLANPSYGEIWQIEAGDDLAGYLAFAYGYSIEFNGRDVFLDEIFITPGYRGKGLGGAALTQLKAHLAAEGVKAAHLEVEAQNPRAQALYQRQEFVLRRNYHLMSVRLD